MSDLNVLLAEKNPTFFLLYSRNSKTFLFFSPKQNQKNIV